MNNPTRQELKNILVCCINTFKEVQTETGVIFSSSDILKLGISLFIQTRRDGISFTDEKHEENKDDKKDEPKPEDTKEKAPEGQTISGNGEDKESVVIHWGRWKGHTLYDVLKRGERSYILWLEKNAKDRVIRTECQRLLNNETIQ